MQLQRQHFLLSYFKTLSAGPAGVDLPHDNPMLNQLSHRCNDNKQLNSKIVKMSQVRDHTLQSGCFARGRGTPIETWLKKQTVGIQD